MFHDVTSLDDQNGDDVDMSITVTSEEAENPDDIDNLSEFKQDVRLRDSTGNFPSWVDSFIRRVIHLLENLPEEGPDGTAGAVEGENLGLFLIYPPSEVLLGSSGRRCGDVSV